VRPFLVENALFKQNNIKNRRQFGKKGHNALHLKKIAEKDSGYPHESVFP